MLSQGTFSRYTPQEKDRYQSDPVIVVEDLKKTTRHAPLISIMISTYNRRAQLRRTLESLARQTFRKIEVLLNDDGSTQDIRGVVDEFSPYLHIKYYHTPRTSWVSCGSPAYHKMLSDVQGKVIAITHPEMLLDERALQLTWNALFHKDFSAFNTYVLDNRPIDGDLYHQSDLGRMGKRYWVSLRPGFFVDSNYGHIDACNWHGRIQELQNTPDFGPTCGFAGRSNMWHAGIPIYPWWFFGAALTTDPIWADMPIYHGHATLDMWLMTYRRTFGIVDAASKEILCYHQPHQTSAVAPEGEQASIQENIARIKK